MRADGWSCPNVRSVRFPRLLSPGAIGALALPNRVVLPGMDTNQVIARFEAERQALALMDHPNIAHVFEGGATASGRPYFVMELVRGIPITPPGWGCRARPRSAGRF